ncbi:MAG: TrbI/VirB10 family protein [Steroidobacteraceae bacterium]
MKLRFGPPRGRSSGAPGTAAPSGASADEAGGFVRGERGITFASRTRSLQAHLHSLLAGGLAVGILLALLVWYYGMALHHSRSAPTAPRPIEPHVSAMGPPALGPIPTLRPVYAVPLGHSRSRASAAAAQIDRHLAAAVVRGEVPRVPAAREPQTTAGASPGAGPRPRAAALIRQLSGEVFIGAPESAGQPAAGTAGRPGIRLGARRSARGSLRALLRPSVMAATRAQLLPQRRLLLAKGTAIDCTLETAIDSTLPGMTTCITATDTFSADGAVVLLARGTQLIGQTRGQVRQGMARVFVIWTQARTPSGVVVRLDSPGTDSLGRSGLAGRVDEHFWERFGAALLVSTLTGVVESRVQSSGGTLIIDPTASEDVLTQTLRAAQDIAPTIEIPNGQRIEVLVARDVDFTPVYELLPR